MTRPFRLLASACFLSLAIGVGCSGGDAAPGGGTGGGAGGTGGGAGGTSGTLAYTPCPVTSRVGKFSIQLKPAVDGAAAFPQFGGGVNNAADPTENWTEMAKDGACRLVVGPKLVCAPACTGGKLCAGQNMCINEPALQDVGTVTVTGLLSALTVMPMAQQYYAALPETPYPPFAVEADIRLSSTGGAYAPIMLKGRGLAPLVFAGTGLNVGRNKALAVTWTAPAQAGSARVFVRLDIGHHGGFAARVECDVPDTGSVSIPAPLINGLIDQGTAGFPTISLTRQTVDSATIAPGCVEFAIASPVERPVTVEGVVSCSEEVPCPAGKTCSEKLTCE